MNYKISRLSPRLVYIRLTAEPTPADDRDYMNQIRELLEAAGEKQYFLVDFRHGMTTNVNTIRHLAELAHHPNFGESIAFASELVKSIYADLFAKLAKQQSDALFTKPHHAIAALEDRHQGLTKNLDWEQILS